MVGRDPARSVVAGRVDYRVSVPRGARVSVANVNGRVEVAGVAADLALNV